MALLGVQRGTDHATGNTFVDLHFRYYAKYTEAALSDELDSAVRNGIAEFIKTNVEVQKQIKEAVELACKTLPLEVIADIVKTSVREAMSEKTETASDVPSEEIVQG